MQGNFTYMLLYSANLAFILTSLYGWLLKRFHRPKAYGDDFERLFPAYKAVCALYVIQIMELPYLLHVGDADALFYANTFAVLFYSPQMLAMCEDYFFPAAKRTLKFYLRYLPLVVILPPLLLQVFHVVSLPEGYRKWAFVIITMVIVVLLWWLVHMAQRIGHTIRQVNEASYADSDDFPVRLARYIQWIPTIVFVIVVVNFYANDPIVKACRDILFTLTNVWFILFTLNPWKKAFTPHEEEIMAQMQGDNGFRLNDARCVELRRQLDDLLTQEHIFTESHITVDTFMQRLGINANYLAEVIRRSGYQSFYDMICQHRVRHAISLIYEHPDEKLLVIADQCGFSSPSSMTKAFKQQGKQPPSHYRRH